MSARSGWTVLTIISAVLCVVCLASSARAQSYAAMDADSLSKGQSHSFGALLATTPPPTTTTPQPEVAALTVDFRQVLNGQIKCTKPNTWTVNVGSSAGAKVFTPQLLNVTVGDIVNFVYQSSFHSVTQTSSYGNCTAMPRGFDTGTQNLPFTYSHVFSTPGVFYYMCTVHCSSFKMYGEITVRDFGIAPAVPDTDLDLGDPNEATETGPDVVVQFDHLFC